jgi:hypothetical protein
MNQTPASDQKNIPFRAIIESKIKHWMNRTKALNGEPRYAAMGMAVGIFVSATPTIPFQTLIAVALAFIMRGSKAAAAVGVWLSNLSGKLQDRYLSFRNIQPSRYFRTYNGRPFQIGY